MYSNHDPERTTARYDQDGIIWFDNPDPAGLLGKAGYCVSDRMFHICILQDPQYSEDMILNIQRQSNVDYSADFSVWRYADPQAPHPFLNKHSGFMLSIWSGADDLEHMVQILEGFEVFDAKWLREALEEKKALTGLCKEDGPFIDRHFNPNKDRLLQQDTDFYKYCWVSAKGGVIYFQPDTPSRFLKAVQLRLQQSCSFLEYGAVEQGNFLGYPTGGPFIQFKWTSPTKSASDSIESILSILTPIPGFIAEPLPEHQASFSPNDLALC